MVRSRSMACRMHRKLRNQPRGCDCPSAAQRLKSVIKLFSGIGTPNICLAHKSVMTLGLEPAPVSVTGFDLADDTGLKLGVKSGTFFSGWYSGMGSRVHPCPKVRQQLSAFLSKVSAEPTLCAIPHRGCAANCHILNDFHRQARFNVKPLDGIITARPNTQIDAVRLQRHESRQWQAAGSHHSGLCFARDGRHACAPAPIVPQQRISQARCERREGEICAWANLVTMIRQHPANFFEFAGTRLVGTGACRERIEASRFLVK